MGSRHNSSDFPSGLPVFFDRLAPILCVATADMVWEGKNLADLFWLFVLYSFLGFLIEVAFSRVVRAEKKDRKCLYFLPLCPVYGFGALAILSLRPLSGGRLFPLFLLGGLAATGVEYLYDLLCEKLFHVRFWDYSSLPLNLGGRVCLLFSFFWGLLALVLVRLVQPGIDVLVSLIPGWLTVPAVLFLMLDILFTVLVLRRTGSTDSLCWYRRFLSRARRPS